MKTQISTSLKLTTAFLFISMLFTQAKAQTACVANWNWQGASSNPCTVIFTNTTIPPLVTGYMYWNFGDGQTSNNVLSPVHTYSASGTYNVCLYITFNTAPICYDTLCKNVTAQCPTGIASFGQDDLSLSVTNPVFSSADIQYSIPLSGSIELVLFDIVGNKIGVLENAIKSAGVHSYILNTGSFSKGIYFIHLNFQGATITKKIIIAE